MALNEVQQSFKFAGGIETKMDSKAVPPVRLLTLENGVFTKAISIQKRNGYTSLARTIDGQTSLVTGARRLGTRDAELLQFTDNRCYSKQTDTDQWVDAGAVIAPLGSDRPAVATGTAQTMGDHATAAGVTVYAWEDSRGGVWWTVEDVAGTVYRAPTQADADGQRPRCVAAGDVLHVYYAVPTQRRVMVLVVNPSTPSAAQTPAILVSDLHDTMPAYDAVPTERGPALIAWREHGTSNVRIGYVHASGTLGTPANGNPSVHRVTGVTADEPLACAFRYVDGGTGDRIFLAHISGATGVVRALDGGTVALGIGSVASTATTAYTFPNDVQRIALAVTATRAWVAFEEAAAEPSERYVVTNSVTFAGVAGAERTQRSVGLASRAWQAGHEDDAFAVFVHDTTYFNVYVALRLEDSARAGRFLPGSATGAPTRAHLPSAHVVDDIVTVTLPYKTRLRSESNDKFTESALRQIRLDFCSDDSHQAQQLGRGLYLAAACPMHYDGRQWTEQGFDVGPERIEAAPADGGSLTPDSTYLYRCWYEWTDAQGEIHRGPESFGTTVELTSDEDEVRFTLPTCRLTLKPNVRICVGRSLPGDTSRLWRVSSLDPTTSGAAANGYLANDTTVDSIAFVDRMSDADLREQEPLYTTGGILSNEPVALGSVVAVGKNRLFFTDSSDGHVIRYSKRLAAGYGAEFAPELMHEINPNAGTITALHVLGKVVVAFTASSIHVFGGDGPLEDGSTAVSGFSAADTVPGNIGCTDPASLAEIPAGLLFKSAQGIWLLGRDLTLSYAGAPAEAYNAQDVRRATVLPDRTQVVFLTSSGKTLLYDHLFGQWSTFTNHEGCDAAVVGGTYFYLRNDDVVYREAIGVYSDAGARITLRFETAWLHLFDHLQGFQRFWHLHLLGTWASPHQLGIQYRVDYGEAWSDPSWLDATGGTDPAGWLSGDGVMTVGEDPLVGSAYGDGAYGAGPYGGTPNDTYQWRFGIHENGQAVQFRFEDFEKSGLAGASFELTEMTITGGAKRPAPKPFSGTRSM